MALVDSVHRREEQVSAERPVRDDPKRAANKIALFQYLTVAVFIFLISGFWKLQVQNPDLYSEAAERNRIKSVPILAPRGRILDRDGRVIVDNKASYSLLLNREQIKPEHLPPIAAELGLDLDELSKKIRRMGSAPQIIIKDQLSRDDIAWIEAHQDDSAYPEMQLIRAWRRQYPQDGFATHVIGYVGEISESELNLPQYLDYQQGDIIGKDGLERQYDDQLRGVDGQQRVLVDSWGHERQMEASKQAVPGKDLHTTLDLDLQAVAELAMQDKRGAVVALDPRNGEILAMVSRPTFDANKFTGRISRTDWTEIAQDPHKPLLNRAIQAQLAPGSTFKPIMAIAGLETGVIDDETHFHCSGGASFYGHYFACHIKRGHGDVNLHLGIVQSCDVFFYNVGNRLGIDRIAQYAELAGIGHKTGVDLPNETQGTMPSSKWKMRMFRQKWYAGETISVAIGQGAVTVSPLQLAAAEGGLGVGGEWYQPHLLRSAAPKLLREGHFNPDNLSQVISGMYGVVNEGGTGRAGVLPGIKVCGKTGTAQVAATEKTKGAKLNSALANNVWFVGFAPMDHPEIVVAALYENGEESFHAVPIVRDVLKAYFDKKARREKKGETETASLLAPLRLLASPVPAHMNLPIPEGLPQ
ncbi:MAG: penicillin-binding protein 2 [Acidobacteriaceae bacterium]|nr:penicillin-binding protein 2 [Acidobacteriaceae bacterium]MBV8569187.1 penicillin-binding protein 2 [Acidobacteriaceae bacterium]